MCFREVMRLGEALAHAAQVAGGERGGARAVGDVVERLDRDRRRRSRCACSAAKIGAKRISPWPGARRFGSFTCTCAIRPVGSQASMSSGTDCALGRAGGAAVDHRPERRAVDGANDLGRLGDGVDQRRLGATERLDAIGDAVRRGDARGVGEELASAGRAPSRASRRRRSRAASASRARARCRRARRTGRSGGVTTSSVRARTRRVGVGERQAGGLDQQPVQAGDDEPGRLDDAADPPRLGARRCAAARRRA